MAYDTRRNRLIALELNSGRAASQGVWEMSLSGSPAWRQLCVMGSGPSPRDYSAVLYDSLGDRVLIHGGRQYVGSSYQNVSELWELSLADVPTWRSLLAEGSPALSAHRMVMDPLQRRILIGSPAYDPHTGVDCFRLWALTLFENPEWSEFFIPSCGPGSPAAESFAYDWRRNRLLFYGGYFKDCHDGTCLVVNLNRLYALALGDTSRWSRLEQPLGTAGRRSGAIHEYDGGRDRLVVVGGVSPGVYVDALALPLDGPAPWIPIIASPGAASGVVPDAGFIDRDRDRLVVEGGGVHGGIWTLPLSGPSAFSAIVGATQSAPIRRDGAVLYDRRRGRILVTDGAGSAWAIPFREAGDAYRLGADGPAPVPQLGHVVAFDPVRDRMILMGGALSDAWVLPLSPDGRWELLQIDGTGPGPRKYQTAITDSMGNRIVLFGGVSQAGARSDLWELSLGDVPRWKELQPIGDAPSPRAYHTAVFDPARRRMIVYGGFGGEILGDCWELSLTDPPEWRRISWAGADPPPLTRHVAAFDPTRDRMILFGYGGPLQQPWILELTGEPRWHSPQPAGPPSLSFDLSGAVYDPEVDRMLVYTTAQNNLTALLWGRPPQEVGVDVRPGSDVDPLNPRSRGSVKAMIRGSDRLDTRSLELTGLVLGGSHLERTGDGRPKVDWRDENGDGSLDLVGHFSLPLSPSPECGDAVSLRGATLSGSRITGTASIRIVPGAGGRSAAAHGSRDTEGRFELRSASPQSAVSGGVSLTMSVPGAGETTLEAFDLHGRRLADLTLGLGATATREIWLPFSRPPSPGIYLIRASHRGQVARAKVAVLP